MTRVALLWHMHQPFYQDPVTGEHILPWVRLHAIKDYWGMVALLKEFPGVRLTFNLVPSLLVQVEAFARNEARDRHLELGLKPADALTEEERGYCLEQFFHAHRPRMIDPYPRYAELLARRGTNGSGLSARSQVGQFSVDDFRDLQVWHKLVWIDAYYHDTDARIRALFEKGRGFSEDDKTLVRSVELELLGNVVPEYREASRRGQVELSTSPFYHPILPLLCDSDIYLRTHPHSRMPREPFRHPEDAFEQLTRAAALHERLFGRKPDGVWPSEGSVSDAMVPLVARAGFRWMATDETILARSMGREFTRDGAGNVEQPELLYRSYRIGGGLTVACGFRDHTLSDLIGFEYASWPSERAADDFVRRLVDAGDRFRSRTGGEATIFVILDGENAWEHYEGQGRPFLRALYRRLESHDALRTVTMSEACAEAHEPLVSIFPGSWINGDFYIWIGHADDHRAWSQLVDARRALETPPAGLSDAALARAREELLIAEGSDWFWWYGDDHSSAHDLEFDDLFRRHVRNVYRALDLPIPEELFVTNITTRPMVTRIRRPTGLIRPTIDGEVTSYFEWIGAGSVEAAAGQSTMHQVDARADLITLVSFGFDEQRLFVRVEGTRPMRDLLTGTLGLTFRFLKPAGTQVVLRRDGSVADVLMVKRSPKGDWDVVTCPDLLSAIGQVAEIAVPFRCLGVTPQDAIAFFVTLSEGTTEREQHPRHQPIELDVPDERFGLKNWRV